MPPPVPVELPEMPLDVTLAAEEVSYSMKLRLDLTAAFLSIAMGRHTTPHLLRTHDLTFANLCWHRSEDGHYYCGMPETVDPDLAAVIFYTFEVTIKGVPQRLDPSMSSYTRHGYSIIRFSHNNLEEGLRLKNGLCEILS